MRLSLNHNKIFLLLRRAAVNYLRKHSLAAGRIEQHELKCINVLAKGFLAVLFRLTYPPVINELSA